MNRLDYWNQGIEMVPHMTGAGHLLDAQDIPSICADLGIALPLQNVLDVGCGTGRLAVHCEGYLGVDIAVDAVRYAKRAGRNVQLVAGAHDLPLWNFDLITCLSVFTHIDRAERRDYLDAFAIRAPMCLVDIIPGDGGGATERWTCDVHEFTTQLEDAGWCVCATTQRGTPDGNVHRYHLLRRCTKDG
jgi:SAM-dependent methyltransferase